MTPLSSICWSSCKCILVLLLVYQYQIDYPPRLKRVCWFSRFYAVSHMDLQTGFLSRENFETAFTNIQRQPKLECLKSMTLFYSLLYDSQHTFKDLILIICSSLCIRDFIKFLCLPICRVLVSPCWVFFIIW